MISDSSFRLERKSRYLVDVEFPLEASAGKGLPLCDERS
jgi:hypothetical protein